MKGSAPLVSELRLIISLLLPVEGLELVVNVHERGAASLGDPVVEEDLLLLLPGENGVHQAPVEFLPIN